MSATDITEHKGIGIHCPKTDCGYTWRYNGKFFWYATCPSCRRNIKILDNIVESESPQSVQVSRQSQTTVFKNASEGTDTH